ncbi:MAG: hypothetical protein AAF541_06135 [Pseudomonadota bacterium]
MKTGSFPHNLKRGEKFVVFGLMGAAAIIVFGSLFGLLVQFLWNSTLMPLAGAGEISFWQAIGVLILAKLFFGFGTGTSSNSSKRKKRRKTSQDDEDLMKQAAFREFWNKEGKAAYESYRRNQGEQGEQEKHEDK